MTVTLSYIANDRSHKVAQAVQQQWEKALGIQVKLEASEQKALSERIRRKESMKSVMARGMATLLILVNFLEIFQYASNPTNQTFWENANIALFLWQLRKKQFQRTV